MDEQKLRQNLDKINGMMWGNRPFGELEIFFESEWSGGDNCPCCSRKLERSSFRIIRGEKSVVIWEIALHFAERHHSFEYLPDRARISEKDQRILDEILN